MAMRRPVQCGDGGGGGGGKVPGCSFSGVYPCLWDFMCDAEWDDGSERETGTVLITSGEGRVRLWLHDRANEQSSWITGKTVEEALKVADEGLEQESLEWRSTKLQSAKKFGKRT